MSGGRENNKTIRIRIYLVELDIIIQISNLEELVAGIHAELFNNNNTPEGNVVLVNIVTKDLLENTPCPDAPIKGFVSAARNVHAMLVFKANSLIFSVHFGVSTVTFVSYDVLTGTQHPLQSGSKDVEIWPSSTLKRTSVRDNISCLDADADLVSQTRPIELVGEPFLIKGELLQYLKVNTINGHQTPLI